jgi:hypothetical protein
LAEDDDTGPQEVADAFGLDFCPVEGCGRAKRKMDSCHECSRKKWEAEQKARAAK